RRLPRRLSRRRLRGAALRVRGGDRGRPRQPAWRDGGQFPRRPARQLRQGAVSRAVVLHALRPHGADPGLAADRVVRPRVMSRRVVGAAAVLAGLGVIAPWLPSYPLTLLIQALISAIFAMSLDVLLGYTGLPSLGHAAYFGVAAYTVAI